MDKKEIFVAGCVIECYSKVLVLRRAKVDSEPGKLGFPAGKIDDDEHMDDAVRREVFEETGIILNDNVKFVYTDKWDVGTKIVNFSTYYVQLDGEIPDVVLNPEEHSDYLWVSPEDLYNRDDSIHGLNDVLEKVYGKNRFE